MAETPRKPHEVTFKAGIALELVINQKGEKTICRPYQWIEEHPICLQQFQQV
jgi:hypothetical protein